MSDNTGGKRYHSPDEACADDSPRKERDWRSMCMIEIAVENPSVSDWMHHWEGRALKAEATLAAATAEAERNKRDALAAIPTSWLDPLLTGPTCVLNTDLPHYTGQDIERLLAAIRKRVSAALSERADKES